MKKKMCVCVCTVGHKRDTQLDKYRFYRVSGGDIHRTVYGAFIIKFSVESVDG